MQSWETDDRSFVDFIRNPRKKCQNLVFVFLFPLYTYKKEHKSRTRRPVMNVQPEHNVTTLNWPIESGRLFRIYILPSPLQKWLSRLRWSWTSPFLSHLKFDFSMQQTLFVSVVGPRAMYTVTRPHNPGLSNRCCFQRSSGVRTSMTRAARISDENCAKSRFRARPGRSACPINNTCACALCNNPVSRRIRGGNSALDLRADEPTRRL